MDKILFEGFHKILEVTKKVKGKEVTREKLILKSAVAGIVIDENNKIALVNQFRPVPEIHTKEIPAGVLDKKNLTPVEILIEELMEECEIPKNEILSIEELPFPPYYMMVGSSDAKIGLYEVKVTAQEDKVVDDVDVDSVEWVDLDTFESYINEGLILDGKTLLAYYYLRLKSLTEK